MDQATSTVTASAQFFRPIEKLEIVRNGEIVASVARDGKRTTLAASAPLATTESCWVAARTTARKEEGEPDIQAHTNPVYVLREGRPVMVRAAREALAARWEAELNYYKNAGLVFASEAQSREFFSQAEQALKELRRPLSTP